MNKQIFDIISQLLEEKGSVILAIEGVCASGKTTLAKEIQTEFDCNVIHMDDFFLPFEMRTEDRMREIGGNVDYERFFDEVVKNLSSLSPFRYGKFDCSQGKIGYEITVKPKKLTVVEGVYSMHPHFDEIYDYKIFLHITDDIKISRLKKRSPDKLDRFINEWIPRENAYFSKFNIKEKCNLIIDNN